MKSHRLRNRRPLLLIAALLAFFTSGLRAAEPFQDFAGSFSKNGSVAVSGGNGVAARGDCKIRFTVSPDGETARLKITGKLRLDGAERAFSSIVVFRRANIAVISNLAPGVDDGYSATDGSYTISPQSIRANFDFVFGTTSGRETLSLRLKKSPRGTRILVTQALVTDSLPTPIRWRFSAVSRR